MEVVEEEHGQGRGGVEERRPAWAHGSRVPVGVVQYRRVVPVNGAAECRVLPASGVSGPSGCTPVSPAGVFPSSLFFFFFLIVFPSSLFGASDLYLGQLKHGSPNLPGCPERLC